MIRCFNAASERLDPTHLPPPPGAASLKEDETEYEYQTLKDICWVATKVEFSSREEKLSFKHHLEVAVLSDKNEQAKFLEIAERDNLSVRELRKAVRDYRKGSG